ncbi:MAG: DUF423 domain-containing protein [Flavobacterium sp.]|jgi:uncharacterized membrane protein YgdD (TMEM256/DUF423 family)|uniref:DUF423 domain-containing protein n=1 Tax=Flavobacterium sp. Leaf359 TaxID=1736351 RepID=UPI0006FD2367|nr:DUF423 domain-containing protein [Flavobacterium sp. Leaf359]KQS46461.1 hypothetical protein ASG38_11705 [Flavobacterium sp. Leaf359]MBU7570904.1 DUF423 domain-containing protein [Flavobacterium sp.]PZO34515.1 MAG: DUF423 domain-containing protein [Flavobacteriaceae bacterium]PZQ91328.1 MAG: DUF423 domain-containing protein [Flavobacterium johnsoniae]
MDRKIIAAAAILGFVAIILGAFGAHALKKVLDVEQLVSFETGVRYQMYHALFLLFLGTTKLVSEKTKSTIYYLVISGVLFFSGSIYLLATRNITNVDFSVIGFITPIGGLLMIIAWALLFLNILKQKA